MPRLGKRSTALVAHDHGKSDRLQVQRTFLVGMRRVGRMERVLCSESRGFLVPMGIIP
jgi:hypothetical protein